MIKNKIAHFFKRIIRIHYIPMSPSYKNESVPNYSFDTPPLFQSCPLYVLFPPFLLLDKLAYANRCLYDINAVGQRRQGNGGLSVGTDSLT